MTTLTTITGAKITVTHIGESYGIVLAEWPSGATQEYEIDRTLAKLLSRVEQ